MITFALILHVIVALVMILVVLLQTGKGAEMGATFGGTSKTLFGPRGAGGPLAKVTVVAAVLFMLTSLFLTYASKHTGGSLLQQATQKGPAMEKSTPAQPGRPMLPFGQDKKSADTGEESGETEGARGGEAHPAPQPETGGEAETPESPPVEGIPPGGN